jgi:hypothetical protein
METDPSPISGKPTASLLIASYGVVILVGAIGLGFGVTELTGGNDGPMVLLLGGLFICLPYALAAGANWLVRHSFHAVLGLLALWVLGGAVSVWLLVDAIWLHPKFLSGLIVIVLPIVQIPVVAVAGLLAWVASRNTRNAMPNALHPLAPSPEPTP